MSETLATLAPSRPRRVFGTAMFTVLALLLLLSAIGGDPQGLVAKIGLPLLGLFFLWRAVSNWQTTGQYLTLSREGIFDQDGVEVCSFENIASVDRSLFALKPSNGFLVRLETPMKRGWTPGIWWRFGRRVGIGGATPAGEGKQMADILAVLLAERQN